jgi:predicted phage terminase large subunit-like protein
MVLPALDLRTLTAMRRRLLIENKTACENSLSAMIRCAWHINEPNTTYLHNWHIDAMSEYLMAVHLGQIKRLLINVPPRMMKSTVVTRIFPIWKWAKEPSHRFVFSSYSADLSVDHSIARRNIITSEWYQERWGYVLNDDGTPELDPQTGKPVVWVRLADDQNQKKVFENTRRGRMQTTSTGGTITGLGGGTIIIDDPHNVTGAQSDADRKSDVSFCKQTLSTRLDDKKQGAIICVMQRLHQKDYSGVVLAAGGWTHLKIPNPNKTPTTYILPISKKKITRKAGELMWEAREGEEEIKQARAALASYGFAGQYLQEPSPEEGGILKRRYFKYYKELPTLWAIVHSWDMAFKDLIDSDKVAYLAMGKKGADIYIMDYMCELLGFGASKAQVLIKANAMPNYTAVVIEDKANGTAIIEEMQRTTRDVLARNPKGGKIARAWASNPTLEAGNVWLPDPEVFPQHAWWVDQFLTNCAAFPNSDEDHDVDAFTQGIDYLKEFGGGLFAHVMQQGEVIAAEKERLKKVMEEEQARIRQVVSR